MNSNFKFKTIEIPLNKETTNIASYKNKDESKLSEKYSSNNSLNHNQLSVKDAVGNNRTTDQMYGQKMPNKFYTKKFGRILQKIGTINSESPNCENMKNKTENNSFDGNLVKNRITNIFTEKISESELSNDQLKERNSNFVVLELHHNNVERKAQAKKQPDKITDMTDILAAPTMGHKLLQEVNNVSEGSEYETELSEEYEIFKSGPSKEDSTTKDMPKNKDFELLITKLKNDNNLAKDIFPTLSGECLHTGVTQTELLQCLKEKGISGTVPMLTKDIKEFFDDATKAGIIKRQNRRFYLNFVDETTAQKTDQSLKLKFVNNNIVGDNIAKKRNGLASTSVIISKSGPSTSNDEAQLYDERGQIEAEKSTTNKGNNADISYLTKILLIKNTIQSKTKKVKKHKITTNRKNATALQHQENDLAKATVLNMIKAAKSRRNGIKFKRGYQIQNGYPFGH